MSYCFSDESGRATFMRILQIEDFFHPDAGYQVNILSKYLVSAGHEVFILAAEMDKVPEGLTSFFGRENIEEKDREFEKRNNVKIIRVPLIGYIANRFIYTNKIFKVIKEIAPDILYVHGNDTYIGIRILVSIHKYKCTIISDSHMLEMASVNKLQKPFRWFYKKFVTPHIIKNNIPIIRTQDDSYVFSKLGIPLDQCPYIPLGSDTMLFKPDDNVKSAFRKEYNIPEEAFVVVYAGKLDAAKGADLLAEALVKAFDIDRNLVFVIVGNTNGEFGTVIEEKFRQSANKIIRFPTQKYSDLAQFFQASDLAVFPKQCSLSFYDVQASGLPVVFEDNNINIGRCKANTAFTFKQNDVSDFRDKIKYCAMMDKREYLYMQQRACKFILDEYSYAETANKYMNVMNMAMKKF